MTTYIVIIALFTVVSALVIVNKSCSYTPLKIIGMITETVLMAAFLWKFKVTITAVKYILLSLALLYAAMCDIKERHCPDCVSIFVFALGFIGTTIDKAVSMLLIPLVTFVFFFIANVVAKKGIGGADIKLYTALSFIFGIKTLPAILISLITSLIGTIIAAKVKKKPVKTADFPMIPYIALGFLILIFC